MLVHTAVLNSEEVVFSTEIGGRTGKQRFFGTVYNNRICGIHEAIQVVEMKEQHVLHLLSPTSLATDKYGRKNNIRAHYSKQRKEASFLCASEISICASSQPTQVWTSRYALKSSMPNYLLMKYDTFFSTCGKNSRVVSIAQTQIFYKLKHFVKNLIRRASMSLKASVAICCIYKHEK